MEAVKCSYRRDNWQDQPAYCEVWSEKATVLGSLRPITQEVGVMLRACRGFGSIGMDGQVGNLLQDIDKPITIFYLGDHDPSGHDIAARYSHARAALRLVRILKWFASPSSCRYQTLQPGTNTVDSPGCARYHQPDIPPCVCTGVRCESSPSRFAMSQDEQDVLKEIIRQECERIAPNLAQDKFFELFSADQVLKSLFFDLDLDQVKAGILGNGGDGGVDAFYVFVNRKLVREDTDTTALRGQKLTIDVVLIQAKNTPGFSELAITKLSEFTEYCLRLHADKDKTRLLYREGIIGAVGKFHEIYRNSLIARPQLSISYYFTSLADRLDPKVETKSQDLLEKVRSYFSVATCNFVFAGAKELTEWFYQAPSKTLHMHASRTLTWPEFGNAYLCIVPLRSFYEFITDHDILRGHIFEANVRDYQGHIEVNNEIYATLANPGKEEFWWLNNGITLLSSKVVASGELLTITDPLIVNGLQTSYEIHRHFKSQQLPARDTRTILVRIIETTSPQSVDQIIKATNSQTKIPRVWLHATEDIHRRIETVLKGVGLYYDRRKNHYRNEGIEPRKIVTIPYLSQALAAIVLQRPEDARGKPTTVAERSYKQLYSDKQPIGLYAKCALIQKRVDEYLDAVVDERSHKLNLTFHVSMYATCSVLNASQPKSAAIANFDMDSLTDNRLADCLNVVRTHYDKQGGDDRAAKATPMTDALKAELVARFGSPKSGKVRGKRNRQEID
jgi:hypothetical protein